MTTKQKINQLIHELQNCNPSDISKYLSPVLDLYPNLNKQEKTEIAEDFSNWATINSSTQPLKFAYGKYLMALNTFFNEDYEETMIRCVEAQKLFSEQYDEIGFTLCNTLIGGSYRTLGNVDLALRELWEAYDHLKKSGLYRHSMMACGFQIGSIYIEMKNYAEALPLFESVFEIATKENNNIWIINTSLGLGKVFLMQKKYPEAKNAFDNAMAFADKLNNPMFIAIAVTDLANYHFETGNYAESETLHEQALHLREEHKFIGGAITNCISLAQIYIKQKKRDEAVSLLFKGLKLAEQIKVKPKMVQIHFLLSEIYTDQNNPDKSLLHYKLYHQLHEEVELADNEKKLKNLQLVFDAEQTRKENIIIKKQKAEIEKKNIELQETIDELTRTRVGKKAKVFTLIIAITLFILEEFILHFVLHLLPEDNFYLSLFVKMAIIFSLKPIDNAIEHYLLKKIIKKRKKEILV